jgi:5S rRNA maturation endonuclease (ribonuclease M5)
VVSTDSHSTVEEIKDYKAGEIVLADVDKYVTAIRKIFKSYDRYAAKAQSLGDAYNDVHKRQILRVTQD